MTAIAPATRPQLSREEVRVAIQNAGVDVNYPALLGIRGYYLDTMGVPGRNDLGLYDDAIFYLSPTTFSAFNANTDPSRIHPHVASLNPGVWRYKIGIHGLSKPVERQYQALIQAAPVVVHRAGAGNDKGWFGVNIHKGGYAST